MKPQIRIGVIAALLCLTVPLLSRVPQGSEWIAQYFPDEGNLFGILFIAAFATVPAIVTFCAALISKPPFYFPVFVSTFVAVVLLGYWHHDNDLSADAQAAISLIFIPIYTAALALAGGVIGIGLQLAAQRLQTRTRN